MALELVIRMRKFGSYRSVAYFRGLTGASLLVDTAFQNRMILVAQATRNDPRKAYRDVPI